LRGRPSQVGKSRDATDNNAQEEESLEAARRLLWSRPGFLVRRLHQIHNGLFFEECGPSTITPLQYGVLTILSRKSDGLDIRSLAMELGIDRSNTADIARRLQKRGYLTQNTAPHDRRALISRITLEGCAFLENMEAAMQRSQTRLLEPLKLVERAAFLSAMTILVRRYNNKGRAELEM
jgi:DNA-binding MarR family transcriptional regulator